MIGNDRVEIKESVENWLFLVYIYYFIGRLRKLGLILYLNVIGILDRIRICIIDGVFWGYIENLSIMIILSYVF